MSRGTPDVAAALGICLEEYAYPYPVPFLPLTSDLQPVAMAYMDIPPDAEPNGKTVVLMHGKAFGCYYFQNVIEALTGPGTGWSRRTRSAGASRPSPTSTTASSCWPPTPRPCSITSASGTSPCSATPPAA